MSPRLTLTGLASQYIHMPLAPFCLKKAVEEALPDVSVTICDLPIGEYTVQEKTSWSWRYDVSGTNKRTVEVLEDQTTTTAYTNTRTNQFWLSGDNWIRNLLSMNSGN